jgi:hypothetical protein
MADDPKSDAAEQGEESTEEPRYVIVGAVKRVMRRAVVSEVLERELPEDAEKATRRPPNMRIQTRVIERAPRDQPRKPRNMSDIFPR